jgi:four helix bundle protein
MGDREGEIQLLSKQFANLPVNKSVEESIIKQKSFKFAIRIFKLYQYLIEEKKDYVVSKQILKSGTSVGANIEEAQGSQSKKDFFSKISISYREARETRYWLLIMLETGYIEEKLNQSLLNDCEEIIKILGKIRTTTRQQLRSEK